MLPARSVLPISVMVRTVPDCTALRTASTPTPKQAQTMGSLSTIAWAAIVIGVPSSASVAVKAGTAALAGARQMRPLNSPSTKDAAW